MHRTGAKNAQMFEAVSRLKSSFTKRLLNQVQPAFENLPFLTEFVESNQLGLPEVQWNKLPLVDWKTVLNGSIPKNSCDFWPAVYGFQDAGGSFVFRDVALYALRLLSLPSSNAVVERVFSVMNSVKTKARNRMSFDLLDSILRIRIRFSTQKICCKNFAPTKDMIHRFTADTVYPQKKSEGEKKQSDEDVFSIFGDDHNELPCVHLPEVDAIGF